MLGLEMTRMSAKCLKQNEVTPWGTQWLFFYWSGAISSLSWTPHRPTDHRWYIFIRPQVGPSSATMQLISWIEVGKKELFFMIAVISTV